LSDPVEPEQQRPGDEAREDEQVSATDEEAGDETSPKCIAAGFRPSRMARPAWEDNSRVCD
jgi:hypothetical protein